MFNNGTMVMLYLVFAVISLYRGIEGIEIAIRHSLTLILAMKIAADIGWGCFFMSRFLIHGRSNFCLAKWEPLALFSAFAGGVVEGTFFCMNQRIATGLMLIAFGLFALYILNEEYGDMIRNVFKREPKVEKTDDENGVPPPSLGRVPPNLKIVPRQPKDKSRLN